jgi:hypothetical protein
MHFEKNKKESKTFFSQSVLLAWKANQGSIRITPTPGIYSHFAFRDGKEIRYVAQSEDARLGLAPGSIRRRHQESTHKTFFRIIVLIYGKSKKCFAQTWAQVRKPTPTPGIEPGAPEGDRLATYCNTIMRCRQ